MRRHLGRLLVPVATAFVAACATHDGARSGNDGGAASTSSTMTSSFAGSASVRFDAAPLTPGAACNGSIHTSAPSAGSQPSAPALTLPAGFTIEVIASGITTPRQLVSLPNGDLLVSTKGTDVDLIPNAESPSPGAPVTFATVNDAPVQGIAFLPSSCTLAIGSQHGIYAVPYKEGQTSTTVGAPIDRIRTGPTAHSVDASVDTDTHTTTSLAFSGGQLYASVGSSCNACVEVDPTRATVQLMNPDGSGVTERAHRVRNAIAVTTNPTTGTVWIGGAGQDDLTLGHPYEYFDALTLHAGDADYGWPDCEENQHAYVTGASCGDTVAPLVEFPAYSTLIAAAFYPESPSGANALPAMYRGGVFVSAHGSWHTQSDGTYYSPPRVFFVAMNGDVPAMAANWSDPSVQWTEFVGGFQLSDGVTRIGRPTGIAVGQDGSLFVADDQANLVYRIRPE